MSSCSTIQTKFSEYLDGRMTGREMQRIAGHLDRCPACAGEWRALRGNQAALASLGPVPEPKDLVLRIRVAVSRERARRNKSAFAGWTLAWRNTVGPFLLQAAAGFASAVLLLGTVTVLVGMFTQPESAQATKDVPSGMQRRRGCSLPWIARPATTTSLPVRAPSLWRPTSIVRERFTTIALSPVRTTLALGCRWRTCSCRAALSRRGSSASRFAAWRCSRSPGYPCAARVLQSAPLV